MKKKKKHGDRVNIRLKDSYGCVLFDEYAENFDDVKKFFLKKKEKLD